MTGSRQVAVERAARRRRAAKEAAEVIEVPSAIVWYARTIGTPKEPWLVMGLGGVIYRAAEVTFSGPTKTTLLSDEARELYPDKPRGIVETSVARLFGATELPRV